MEILGNDAKLFTTRSSVVQNNRILSLHNFVSKKIII
jgi:hypothetical protein